MEQLVGAKILLLLTYRPGYCPPWIDKSYATQVALARLEPRDSRRMVQAIRRTAPMPEAVIQVILARAEGNLLFLEELSSTVVDQDGSHRSAGVPTTLQAVLASRIDRLLWQQQGKRTESWEILAPIYNWFTEGLETVDVREAKTMVEELSPILA